ncbi:MAG: imidazole glycerol phosphate synthase subunit HisH [Desulfobacterales bacterium]|nr:imidazole glycerol phosphate synthase subunit HisH [Desulfobacterales bacterium]
MNNVIVIDYDMGNTDSILRAIEECGGNPVLSNKKSDLDDASHIILPGVGSFQKAMENINSLEIIDSLEEQIFTFKVPFLGICLGMQLMATQGAENGVTNGLNWINGNVVKFQQTEKKERIPHIGWNEIHLKEPNPLFEGIESGKDFYFVNSFHFECTDKSNELSKTPYCGEFVSAVNKDNLYGVQFHPEKSQKFGFKIIKNFLAL